MKKISVICPPRKPLFEFYSYHTKCNIELLPPKLNNESDYSITKNCNVSYCPMDNIVPFDITKLSTRHAGNFSLRKYNNLEDKLKHSDGILISDTYYLWNWQAIRIARKYDIPIITEIWCNLPTHITQYIPPYSHITNLTATHSTHFILRNKAAYKFTDNLKISRNKCTSIYMGINLNKFKQKMRDKITIPNILYVGQLDYAKGVDNLLDAFISLSNNLPATLTIAGKGALESKIKKLSTNNKIKLIGHIDYEYLPSIYANADIFCSPSKPIRLAGYKLFQDYFPYTLIEAQAAGLPIVSTNSDGIKEMLPISNSIVDENDTTALSLALKNLIVNKQIREYIGDINRKNAEEKFNIIKQSALNEKLILDTV